MRKGLLILLFVFWRALLAAENYDTQQIEQRIQPIGRVHAESDTSGNTKPEGSQPAVKAMSGQEIFEKHCVVCHEAGVAGAPKLGDANDWNPRLTAKKLSGLQASAIKGLNAMPARGTCGECSDDDIKNAILYMLPKP